MPNRPKPSHLKVVQGTVRKDRVNKREPKPKLETPKPPGWMSDEGKVMWGRFSVQLEQMGVLTAADGPALELLVTSYLEFVKLEKQLADEGYTYLTVATNGERVTKANPAASMLREARQQHRMLLIEFGLTPAARTKVHTVQRGNKNPDEEADKPRKASTYF